MSGRMYDKHRQRRKCSYAEKEGRMLFVPPEQLFVDSSYDSAGSDVSGCRRYAYSHQSVIWELTQPELYCDPVQESLQAEKC